jgi:filamentous hemagglutinin
MTGPQGGPSQGTSPYPAGAPREIDGYTQHGLKQVTGRDGGVGVTDSAMNDAVEDPLKVEVQPGGRFRFIGKTATVVLNSAGKVVTAWARTSSAWRLIP